MKILKYIFLLYLLGQVLTVFAGPHITNSYISITKNKQPVLTNIKNPKDCQQLVDKKTCHEIGQMLIVGFGGIRENQQGKKNWVSAISVTPSSEIVTHITRDNVGGVILFDNLFYDSKKGCFLPRNISSPFQLKTLTARLQCYALRSEHHPIIISTDEEGGLVARLSPIYGFATPLYVPNAMGEAEQLADHLMKSNNIMKQARAKYMNHVIKKTFLAVATELSTYHINMDFAPVVDVNINPVNPVIGLLGRSFSSNPQIVIQLAKKFIDALHSQGITVSLKHFPGHGSSLADDHLGLVDVTNTYRENKELMPYRALISNMHLVDAIMTTHLINGNIDKTQCKPGKPNDHTTWCPGTMSRKTLTELLRKQLGFTGLIISDDMTMGAITKEYGLKTALEKGINAGVDMFIVANLGEDETNTMINTIAELIQEGKVTKSQIHQAYQHVMQFKQQHFSNYSEKEFCN